MSASTKQIHANFSPLPDSIHDSSASCYYNSKNLISTTPTIITKSLFNIYPFLLTANEFLNIPLWTSTSLNTQQNFYYANFLFIFLINLFILYHNILVIPGLVFVSCYVIWIIKSYNSTNDFFSNESLIDIRIIIDDIKTTNTINTDSTTSNNISNTHLNQISEVNEASELLQDTENNFAIVTDLFEVINLLNIVVTKLEIMLCLISIDQLNNPDLTLTNQKNNPMDNPDINYKLPEKIGKFRIILTIFCIYPFFYLFISKNLMSLKKFVLILLNIIFFKNCPIIISTKNLLWRSKYIRITINLLKNFFII
ncbi:uncharacterized protein ASCRUDRAFT_133574 [Ascoidea rubescens DSM 1968]|uniref:TECPR1-like DysF domain-containing protein n=1 Tax=Ascoidea rubescens DSM 1968 TaxID=1344418 RepID=A0A1D2VKX9_9ASCO|nr:hypothetical protein ASCRUDRAFT_133574 [Ascoidea rubescens DSM 1968]ODV62263.1 hypothetical protein ASCRUDRAFT_133574 [Ascoidea rubescens DSM 1968]